MAAPRRNGSTPSPRSAASTGLCTSCGHAGHERSTPASRPACVAQALDATCSTPVTARKLTPTASASSFLRPVGHLDDAGRLRLLYELGNAFAARLELRELLPLVVDKCRDVIEAEGAAVLLLDRDADE